MVWYGTDTGPAVLVMVVLGDVAKKKVQCAISSKGSFVRPGSALGCPFLLLPHGFCVSYRI